MKGERDNFDGQICHKIYQKIIETPPLGMSMLADSTVFFKPFPKGVSASFNSFDPKSSKKVCAYWQKDLVKIR